MKYDNRLLTPLEFEKCTLIHSTWSENVNCFAAKIWSRCQREYYYINIFIVLLDHNYEIFLFRNLITEARESGFLTDDVRYKAVMGYIVSG